MCIALFLLLPTHNFNETFSLRNDARKVSLDCTRISRMEKKYIVRESSVIIRLLPNRHDFIYEYSSDENYGINFIKLKPISLTNMCRYILRYETVISRSRIATIACAYAWSFPCHESGLKDSRKLPIEMYHSVADTNT